MASSSPEAFDDRPVRKEQKKYRQQPENHLVLQHGLQVISIRAVAVFLHAFGELVFPNPLIQIGSLLRGGNAHPLVLLNHTDKVGRPAQGFHRARIHPSIATAEHLVGQLSSPSP